MQEINLQVEKLVLLTLINVITLALTLININITLTFALIIALTHFYLRAFCLFG